MIKVVVIRIAQVYHIGTLIIVRTKMNKQVDITAESDMAEGTMKAVSIERQEVLLARTQDDFYAVSNICPHMKGKLSEGTLDGNIVTCPRHGWQFDVRTGENVRWLKGSGVTSGMAKLVKPPRPIKSYDIEVKDGRIVIEIQ
ncbi:MAG: Rieske 2Fe-2S domain-containing protein [Dehalococcoidales bacterium]|nr:MAG: Rieske 2Fe-2S domain-containing protein [Dehalococcoidales bacterium]